MKGTVLPATAVAIPAMMLASTTGAEASAKCTGAKTARHGRTVNTINMLQRIGSVAAYVSSWSCNVVSRNVRTMILLIYKL